MVEGNTGRRAKVSAVRKRRGHGPHHARKEVVGTWETRMRSAAGHRRVRKQQVWLNSVLRGHYACYGITGNARIDRLRVARAR